MKNWMSFIIVSLTMLGHFAHAWDIDFSRREKYLKPKPVEGMLEADPTTAVPEKVTPDTVAKVETPSTKQLTNNLEVAQEIVILNTEKGFVPSSLSLRANTKYKISVVNVNEKEKNVSFIMSAFSQYQGTFFGQIKSFEIVPPKEGVYTYECPETSQLGRVVVIPSTEVRTPASEK
jgi:hypothetical protein